MMQIAAVLVSAVCLVAAGAQPKAPVVAVLSGAPDAETRRGIELGAAEAAQTLRLLGREIRMTRNVPPGTDLAGILVVDRATSRVDGPVPQIHLGALPAGADACSFSVGPAPGGGELWHPTLNRFGASELNERFVKQHEVGMSSRAYAGWLAVKALVESALRARGPHDRCASVARLRFDGHKGRPLWFDPQTRILRQPTYVVQDGRVVGERQ